MMIFDDKLILFDVVRWPSIVKLCIWTLWYFCV